MIDNLALLIFGSLVFYTVLRAVKLDKQIPWFSDGTEKKESSSPRRPRR